MSKYTVRLKRSALKQLQQLPKKEVVRLRALIVSLGDNPRPSGCKKLKSYPKYWRVRSGNYRVIYTIKDDVLSVEVLKVLNRKDAYR
jgi:mRNA interferase RelE/StbE